MSLNRWNKHSLLSFIDSHIINYPTPINLNYMWSFGSTAGLCLGIQILTGIFLAMHYSSHVDYLLVVLNTLCETLIMDG